jgi:protein-L-isoaspartate(D-aspartate) O-methyltransferase
MVLIDELIRDGYLKAPEIISAFKKIKRDDFILPENKNDSEINAPLPIGYGQTISQPLTVAFMLELLEPKEGEKILDVGSGSGWTTALLAEIVGKKGKVFALEIIPKLKEFGEKNVSRYNFIKKGTVLFIEGDGWQGLPEFAPFDKVLVSAAASRIPEKLLEQIKIGGRLVIPIGENYQTQEIVLIDKIGENKYKEKRFPGFVFVPLVDK